MQGAIPVDIAPDAYVAKKQHDFIKTMQIHRKGCGM